MSISSYGSYRTFTAPNWELIPHKESDIPSKKELISQIQQLAEKKAKTTDKNELESISYQKAKLRAQFLSSAAPDRKMLYEQAEQSIESQKRQKPERTLGELTLLDFLYSPESIKNFKASSSSGSVSSVINSLGGYDYDVSIGGNTVLRTINGKWCCTLTPAELVEQNEFNRVFDGAYDATKRVMEISRGLQNALDLRESHFDMKA